MIKFIHDCHHFSCQKLEIIPQPPINISQSIEGEITDLLRHASMRHARN